MNGHASRPSADDYGPPPPSALDPHGRVVVEAYSNDIARGFEKDAPMYNAVGHPNPRCYDSY